MWLFSIFFSLAFADVNRIESKYLTISESSKIYLKPGLVSVLEFPHNILEVRIGNPSELKGIISQISPKEITLYFKNSQSQITNLIVRSDRKMYVFDVIPSNTRHQDYVKISGATGNLTHLNSLNLLESVSIRPKSNNYEKTQVLLEKRTL